MILNIQRLDIGGLFLQIYAFDGIYKSGQGIWMKTINNNTKIRVFSTALCIAAFFTSSNVSIAEISGQSLSSKQETPSKISNVKAKVETIVVDVDINSKIYYDYEVFTNKDGTFSIPLKYTAELLEIPIEQNKITKEITFKIANGETVIIDAKNQTVIIGSRAIKTNMVFCKSGILDETKDEVFLPIKIVNEILGTEIVQDFSNYSVSINTEKQLKSLVSYAKEQDKWKDPFADYVEPDYTFAKVFEPEKKKKISLDSIIIEENTQYYTSKTEEALSSIDSINNYTQIKYKGDLLGGKYEIKNNPRVLTDKSFSIGGFGFNYDKEFQKYNLSLGTIDSSEIGSYKFGDSVLGINVCTKPRQQDFKDQSGMISPGSKVNVYVNNKLVSTQNTKGGYYSLKDVSMPDNLSGEVKLEEVTLQGTARKIKEDYYSTDPYLLRKGERQYSLLGGMTGYSNILGDKHNYVNDYYSKKLTGGVKMSYGFDEKTTMSFALLGDNILHMSDNNSFYGGLRNNSAAMNLILNSYRDFNPIEGQTGLFSTYYVPKKDLILSTDLGISHAKSKNDSTYYKIDPLGYSANLSAKYDKPKYTLNGRVYDYSSSFYLAGASGLGNSAALLNDRMGGELGGNFNINNLAFNGKINTFYSNLDKRLEGDKRKNYEYNFSTMIPINSSSDFSYYQSGRKISNSAGDIDNNNYELEYNIKFTPVLESTITGKYNSFNNDYTEDSTVSNYSTKFKNLNAKLDYELPKNIGTVNLAHDIVKINTNDYDSNYNSVSIGFTPAVYKNIALSSSVGIHYTGLNKGLEYSASLGYMFPSGRVFQVSYQYNRQAGIFYDDYFIPSTSRHSIMLNMSDSFSLIGGGIRSVGSLRDEDGFIKVITFLDNNKNGIRDKKEPVISKVPINLAGIITDAKTNRKGVFMTKGLEKGLYNVAIGIDNLPGLLSVSPASKQECLVKVDPGNLTVVDFGLISSVGNINGKVNILDSFNRKVDIKDLIVTVYDPTGKEITYTNVEDDGTYSISGLSPGEYFVQIDKDFVNEYRLELKDRSMSKKVVIPAVYDNYVDIKDTNLEYLQTI